MTNDTTSTPRVDVHLTADDLRTALRSDADRGLRSTPKDIPPKWFYDDRGSQLFDDITRLPEYYPTRRERAILEARAREIARGHARRHARRARLGNVRQDADPARRVARRGHDHALRPVRRERADVARRGRRGRTASTRRSPCTRSSATSSTHLGTIPGGGRRLVAFLGGTIGNLLPPAARRVPARDREGPRPRRPPPARPRPREGRRPPRSRVRRRAGRHRRVQQERARRDEPRARRRLRRRRVRARRGVRHGPRADRDATARRSTRTPCTSRALELDVPFAAGEEMRTEVSAKFTREQVVERARDRRHAARRAGGPTPTATSPSLARRGRRVTS